MEYLRVMVAQAFLKDRYVGHGTMFAKLKPKVNVLLIKLIEINVVRVASKNVFALA